MSNQGLSSCADNTIQAIKSCGITSLTTDEYALALIGNYQKYVSALGKQVTNDSNKALNTAYNEVSFLLTTFRKATEVLALSRTLSEKSLGERVMNHLYSLDRSWNKMKKKEQKSFLTNLIDEFSKPEYATAMAVTPLAPLFEQIKVATDAYSIALKNSNDRNEVIKATDSATSMRDPLVDSYNNCYYHIQAMAHVSTDSAWAKLLISIDALHDNERIKLRTKQAVAANAAEESKARLTIAPPANSTTDTKAV